jgi:hypothetical protein
MHKGYFFAGFAGAGFGAGAAGDIGVEGGGVVTAGCAAG